MNGIPDLDRPVWMLLAECRGSDPDIWYPHLQRGENTRWSPSLELPLSVCRRCDVQVECLTHALNTAEPFGIWGGLTARQRVRIRRRHTAVVA